MNRILKRKWLKALRSGRYKQGQGFLRRNTVDRPEYCCLGVLCQVAGLKRIGIAYSYGGVFDTCSLPESFRIKIGITTSQQSTLIGRNDRGLQGKPQSFKDIADYIEKRL